MKQLLLKIFSGVHPSPPPTPPSPEDPLGKPSLAQMGENKTKQNQTLCIWYHTYSHDRN